eukprot:2762269-Prymnesium_polylepis.1
MQCGGGTCTCTCGGGTCNAAEARVGVHARWCRAAPVVRGRARVRVCAANAVPRGRVQETLGLRRECAPHPLVR